MRCMCCSASPVEESSRIKDRDGADCPVSTTLESAKGFVSSSCTVEAEIDVHNLCFGIWWVLMYNDRFPSSKDLRKRDRVA